MLHRLNRESMAAAIFQDDTLVITTKSGATAHQLNATELLAVSLTKLPVANRLMLRTKHGQDISINGLDRSTSQELYTDVSGGGKVGRVGGGLLNIGDLIVYRPPSFIGL